MPTGVERESSPVSRSGRGSPERWFQPTPSLLRSAGKLFLLLLVCAYFGFSYGSDPSFLNLEMYTAGKAPTPYQYRVLPMFFFRFLMHISLLPRLAHRVEALKDDPYRLILMILAFVSLLGALAATRLTLKRLTGDPVYAFWAAFLVALMAELQLASTWGPSMPVPYDVPSICFFALSIYLVVSRRLLLFYLLFPLAVLNRETACFISVFFAVWEWVRLSDQSVRGRLLRIVPAVAAQALVWFGIKTLLFHVFAHNPAEDNGVAGGLFVNKLTYNLHELPKPQQWPLLASICSFSLPFLYLQRRWIRCDGLAYACAIVLPLSFAGMMIVGVITEIRIFADWIALVAPTLALVVHNRFRPVADNMT